MIMSISNEEPIHPASHALHNLVRHLLDMNLEAVSRLIHQPKRGSQGVETHPSIVNRGDLRLKVNNLQWIGRAPGGHSTIFSQGHALLVINDAVKRHHHKQQ